MHRFGMRAGLSVTAATTLIMGLSAVPAAADPAPPTSGLSRSFEIQNLSQNAAFFAGIDGGDSLSGGPGVGAVLQPGQRAGFSASSYVFSDGDVYPVYKAWPDNDPSFPHTHEPPFRYVFHFHQTPMGVTSYMNCGAENGECTTIDDRIGQILDGPGEVVTFGPGEGQKQAKTLLSLCADDRISTCSFSPTSHEVVYSENHQVYTVINNETSTVEQTTIGVNYSATESSNISIAGKVSAKLGSIINAEVSGTIGRTWSQTVGYTQQVNVTIPVNRSVSFLAKEKVDRVHGDFTIKIGNTTWNLPGIYLDTPIANTAVITTREGPLVAPAPGDAPAFGSSALNTGSAGF
jgi:hypothetical protein